MGFTRRSPNNHAGPRDGLAAFVITYADGTTWSSGWWLLRSSMA